MNVIQNVQGLRGIAVLFVLFVHVGIVEKKYSLHPVLPDIVQFGMCGVDIFFVISGFIMMSISILHKKDMTSAFKFLYFRIIRIYPIYWFYTLLILLVFLLQPEWVNSSSNNEVDLLKSFLLVPQNGNPLLQVGWTLIHEMYFYIGFFLLILLFRSKRAMILGIVTWGTVVVILDILLDFTNPIYKLVLHPLTLEFIGGAMIAYIVTKITIGLSVLLWKMISLLSVFLLLIHYYLFDAYYGTDPFGWWRVILFGFPAMLLLYAFVKLEKNGKVLPAWLRLIGDRSYTIYLAHLLVINVVGRVWQIFEFDSISMSVLFIIILIGATLIYAKYAYEWIEVPMISKLKQLKGRS